LVAEKVGHPELRLPEILQVGPKAGPLEPLEQLTDLVQEIRRVQEILQVVAKVERLTQAVLEMRMGRALARAELLMLQVAQMLRVKVVLLLREMFPLLLVVVAPLGREEIQMQPLNKKTNAHRICLTNLPRNFEHR
jgi:hypothetical protein